MLALFCWWTYTTGFTHLAKLYLIPWMVRSLLFTFCEDQSDSIRSDVEPLDSHDRLHATFGPDCPSLPCGRVELAPRCSRHSRQAVTRLGRKILLPQCMLVSSHLVHKLNHFPRRLRTTMLLTICSPMSRSVSTHLLFKSIRATDNFLLLDQIINLESQRRSSQS